MQEVDEIVSRLARGRYRLRDIREAADLIAGIQTHQDTLKLSRELRGSEHAQVRTLGLCLAAAISPAFPEAAGSLRETTMEERGVLERIKLLGIPENPQSMPYPGLVSIIKCWINESMSRPHDGRPGGTRA